MDDMTTNSTETSAESSESQDRYTSLIKRVDDFLAGRDGISQLMADAERRWRIPRTADYLSMDLPPVDYLVGDWCAVGAPILVSGPTKCGKTFFMYSLAHAVSIGASIFGWQTPSGGAPVAIVDGEMRPQSIKRRLQSITKHIPGAGEMQILTRELFTDQGDKFPDLSAPKEVAKLLNRISPKERPVKVIVFDNINSLFKGDENQPGYWNQIEDLIKACRTRGIAAWLVHHNPKSHPESPAGSSKAERFPEVVIVLQKIGTSAGQAAHFNVKFRHCRDMAMTAVDFSARFDDDTGWCVGDYLPQDIGAIPDAPGRRETALALLAQGQSWQTVAGQTGLSKATIFRLKAQLPIPK
jgi:KaiC/GvpD/RAD55 family RecA-like ATPase